MLPSSSTEMLVNQYTIYLGRNAFPGSFGLTLLGGGLSGYVKSKPLGNGQIISIDVLVLVMIIAVFHKKLI